MEDNQYHFDVYEADASTALLGRRLSSRIVTLAEGSNEDELLTGLIAFEVLIGMAAGLYLFSISFDHGDGQSRWVEVSPDGTYREVDPETELNFNSL